MSRHNNKTQLNVEALEERSLMSISMLGQTLQILGTSEHDQVSITAFKDARGHSRIKVHHESVFGDETKTFDASKVKSIACYLYGGNDYYRNDTMKPSRAFGGDGNDVLIGGGDGDMLVGEGYFSGSWETGNDRLYGRGGDDVLAGQKGSDLLCGGNNNDYLFGGADADFLFGEAGNDYLFGGDYQQVPDKAADSVQGGSGKDTFYGEWYYDQDVDTYWNRDWPRDYKKGVDVMKVHTIEKKPDANPAPSDDLTGTWHHVRSTFTVNRTANGFGWQDAAGTKGEVKYIKTPTGGYYHMYWNGSFVASGSVERRDANGTPTQIGWSNNATWYR